MNSRAQCQTELDEEGLIFIAEIMVLMHLRMKFMTPSLLTALVLSNGTDEMLRMDDVREEGQRWLSEVLVWED